MINENEDKYGTREVQNYLLNILIYFDNFCRQYDIKYSLNGGSLLGAIRHKGYIPWDDDIDIMFDRENYEKFLKNSKNLSNEYTIIGSIWVKRLTRKDNPEIDSEEGCIDLLVFDNVPDNPYLAKYKHFMLKVMQGMLKKKINYQKFSFSTKILLFGTHVLGLPFTTSLKQKWYDSLSQIGNNRKSKYVNIYNSFFKQISTFKYNSSMLDNYIYTDFEGYQIMILRDYDHYLTVAFGDYMKLPPESERIPMHTKKKMASSS